MIDETGANLRGRSEFITALDISSAREARQQNLEQKAVHIHEALILDEAWEASPLPAIVEETAEKFGSVYTTSSNIGPRLDRHQSGPQLPLRLGARVRDVFIAGDGTGPLEAVRGQLIMHRSLQDGVIKNTGFFVLLAKEQGQGVPILTYGRTDIGSSSDTDRNQLPLEVLLGPEISIFRAAEPMDVATYRERLRQFNVQKIMDSDEKKAKVAVGTSNITWQKAYLNIFAKDGSPLENDRLEMLSKLFGTERISRRFRRDTHAVGLLRQNEGPYIDGQDCSEITEQLQNFFDQVHDPIGTRPDQKAAALADLEHGTHLEAVDAYQVSEIDVARSIISRQRALGRTTATAILPLNSDDFPYDVRQQLCIDYSRYPDLKERIDTCVREHAAIELEQEYPEIEGIMLQGDKSEAWLKFNKEHPEFMFHTSFSILGSLGIYEGRLSYIGGLPMHKHEKLMKELAQMTVKPSAQAFPFD